MTTRPWKEPAVSPIKATDEIRWTLLLQQSQSILWQLISLGAQCDFWLRQKVFPNRLEGSPRGVRVRQGRDG